MSTYSPMHKILVIGAGPIRIGQNGALDDAACRACDVIRQLGMETVMVHCDPSALATDIEMADRTYMVPIALQAVTDVLLKEKPDAILPTVGGPAALRLTGLLADSGILTAQNIRLLGMSAKTLAFIDDAGAFFQAAEALGVHGPEGQQAASIADTAALAETIGYPVFVRAAEPGRTVSHGIAFNVEELRLLASGGRLPAEVAGQFRVEPALTTCTEVEVCLLRDRADCIRTVAVMENMDPVGIHSCDSLAAVPPLTLEADIIRKIAAGAESLAGVTDATGVIGFKFAVDRGTADIVPIAVDTGYGRVAGFVAHAFDIPLATVHARLCLGMSMESATADLNGHLSGPMAGDTVAVRLPRWEFDRFPGEMPRLDARMKSTGAAMGLGATLPRALMMAIRARSPQQPLPGRTSGMAGAAAEVLLHRMVTPSPDRLAMIYDALNKGADADAVAGITGIDARWIHPLAELAGLEAQLMAAAGPLPATLADRAIRCGFDATALACLLDITTDEAADRLSAATLHIGARPVSSTDAPRIWFSGPIEGPHPEPLGKSVLLVGPGPARIGQGIEPDHGCAHAAKALKAAGRRAIMASANSAPACGTANLDRIHAASLTAGDLQAVCRAEAPEGVILQFGGFRAMQLAPTLIDAGYPVLGTPHASTALCQDRIAFSRRLTELGIAHPPIGMAATPEAVMDLAEEIGYPLMAGSPGGRQGRRRTILMDARMLERFVMETGVSDQAPLLLEQFLEYAIEVEADALCDGQRVYVPAVMEHIELAGVHAGDVAMVVPPYSTPPRHVETIAAIIDRIALALGIKGVFNSRFAVLNDTVYLLEVRTWACRTLPMISKICNVPMAQRAVQIMLGMTLDEMDLPRCLLPHYAIRSSVFPFDRFTDADPLLGPRMHATGQAMVLADVFGMAYFTSQEAAGPPLPLGGKVLITVTDTDKPSILEPARLFIEMGFGIQATRGTHAFLKKNGIDAELVKKLGFGRPDLVDGIKTDEVSLVVNTPSGSRSQQDDAYIRKTAIRYSIPHVTTPAAALAAAKGIAARKRGQDALRTLQSYVRAIR